MMRTCQIYSLINFEINKSILVTTVAMLYIISPELIYLITEFVHFHAFPLVIYKSSWFTDNMITFYLSCLHMFFPSLFTST